MTIGFPRIAVNCAFCHGKAGLANGITSKFGVAAIANLKDDRIKQMPDGQIFSTITNGMMAFGLYGFAFIGNWIEQIGTFASNVTARNVGTVSSLVMPTESLWNLASYQMQPSIMRELTVTPFSPVSVPSTAMVWWAIGYIVVAMAIGLRAFRHRAL